MGGRRESEMPTAYGTLKVHVGKVHFSELNGRVSSLIAPLCNLIFNLPARPWPPITSYPPQPITPSSPPPTSIAAIWPTRQRMPPASVRWLPGTAFAPTMASRPCTWTIRSAVQRAVASLARRSRSSTNPLPLAKYGMPNLNWVKPWRPALRSAAWNWPTSTASVR